MGRPGVQANRFWSRLGLAEGSAADGLAARLAGRHPRNGRCAGGVEAALSLHKTRPLSRSRLWRSVRAVSS